MQPAQTLYDADFYLWTQQQAALLREGKWQALDYANLAAARRQASRDTRLPETTFPATCPWSVKQLLDEEFWPEAEGA